MSSTVNEQLNAQPKPRMRERWSIPKLEVVVIAVSDVDRAKRFYGSLGWRPDADFAFDNWLPGRPIHAARLGLLGPIRQRTSRRPRPARPRALYLVVAEDRDRT